MGRWQIDASQAFLQDHVSPIVARGVNTLEELSILSHYYTQCASLGDDPLLPKLKIADQLKKNTGDWVEFLHAQARLDLGCFRFDAAKSGFQECLAKAKAMATNTTPHSAI